MDGEIVSDKKKETNVYGEDEIKEVIKTVLMPLTLKLSSLKGNLFINDLFLLIMFSLGLCLLLPCLVYLLAGMRHFDTGMFCVGFVGFYILKSVYDDVKQYYPLYRSVKVIRGKMSDVLITFSHSKDVAKFKEEIDELRKMFESLDVDKWIDGNPTDNEKEDEFDSLYAIFKENENVSNEKNE